MNVENWDKNFVCKFAMPGIGCEIYESILLSVLFYLEAFISIVLLIKNIRNSKPKSSIIDQTSVFWIFLATFQLYRGTTFLVPFHWTPTTFKIFYVALDHILLFTPMCLVILILFDLLFAYRSPGTNAIKFFRYIFLLFLFTFVALGIFLSFFDLHDSSDPDMSLSLWGACTDLIIAIFFMLPAFSLLEAVTYPMVQPEDVCCVNFCKVGIISFVVIFLIRMVYNVTHYFSINPLQEYVSNELEKSETIPNTNARIISFFYYFLFDFVPSLLGQISVYLFKKHDLMFNENPYYTRQSD